MTVEYSKDQVRLDDLEERRSIASIVLRKPTSEELQACHCCRIFCIVGFFIILLGLLVTSIVLIAVSEKCNRRIKTLSKSNVVYEIDVNSFFDSDKNGANDGVTSKLDYIKSLGVNTIILNNAVNHINFEINTDFGSLQDIQNLFHLLKEKEMFSIVSIDPLWVSINSSWFEQTTNESMRNWFVVTNETNNWKTVTNSTAWFRLTGNLSYYSYAGVNKPMLNYHNEDVVKMLKSKLKYWMELGSNGFFIKSVSRLTADEKFRSNDDIQTFDQDQDRTHVVLHEIHSFVENNKGVVWISPKTSADKAMKYFGVVGRREADFIFNEILAELKSPVSVTTLYSRIVSFTSLVPTYGDFGWITSGEGYPRISNRFKPAESARLVVLFSLLLPGKVIVYNGEESLSKSNSVDWNSKAIDGYTRLSKLRGEMEDFDSRPTIRVANKTNDALEIVYNKRILVAANFKSTPHLKKYKGDVLFDSSSSDNEGQTREVSLQPYQIIVLENFE